MKLLILGSGPNVISAQDWAKDLFDRILVINNAWRVRPDWDDLICPEDFPADRRPPSPLQGQRIIEADRFVPAQNSFGGFVYAGGTMAFTAGYWALAALRPRVMAYMGCDMTYGGAQTHFYGKGAADPLRPDISLRSLEAKSNRLMALAALQGCACVNLSTDESRLTFPRAVPDGLSELSPLAPAAAPLLAATTREATLGYMVESGRYWEEADRFDTDRIDGLDRLWLRTYDWKPHTYARPEPAPTAI